MKVRDGGWTLLTLKEHILALLEERDRAVNKLEESTEKRFEGVNEFRLALNDSAKLNMPREEANARFDSILRKIEDNSKANQDTHTVVSERLGLLAQRMDKREGETAGSREVKGDSKSYWVVVIAVAAVLISFLQFIYTLNIHK